MPHAGRSGRASRAASTRCPRRQAGRHGRTPQVRPQRCARLAGAHPAAASRAGQEFLLNRNIAGSAHVMPSLHRAPPADLPQRGDPRLSNVPTVSVSPRRA
jgi:hypothetical protein